MKIKHIFPVLFLSLCILPTLAFGKSYYVDCSASQNGDGSYDSPWTKSPREITIISAPAMMYISKWEPPAP